MKSGSAYKITNSNGRSDLAWREQYASRAEAAEAIRDAMGWESVVLSESYACDEGTAWSAYETQEECDADQEGAYAPRVVRVDVDLLLRELEAARAEIERLRGELAPSWDKHVCEQLEGYKDAVTELEETRVRLLTEIRGLDRTHKEMVEWAEKHETKLTNLREAAERYMAGELPRAGWLHAIEASR